MRLRGLTAVITGAGGGIGRACAREFAKDGASIVVADINHAGALETARAIQDSGGNAVAVETDVADSGSVQRLVDRTLDAFSQVHVLLNNAAVQVNKNIEDLDIDITSRPTLGIHHNARPRGGQLSGDDNAFPHRTGIQHTG